MSNTLLIAALCVSSSAAFAATDSLEAAGPNDVVAVVNGTRLTLSDVERKQSLFQARNTFFEAERKAVDQAVEASLLEQQAAKEHVTVQQLLDLHIKSQLPPDPPDDALRVYYEGLDTRDAFEAVKDKILDHIREARTSRARSAYIQSLRSAAQISLLVQAPRTQVALRDTPVRGPAGASVTLIEYADYECPYCQQIQPALEKLETEYKDKIAFAYKDLPLPMHPHAQKAAEAAQCAGVQDKYWDYHDYLLKSNQLDLPQLKEAARTLKLDAQAFDQCLDSGQRANSIKATLDEATQLGIQGTPSFFLNGRFFSGNMPYDQLRQMVEDELQKSSVKQQQASGR